MIVFIYYSFINLSKSLALRVNVGNLYISKVKIFQNVGL